MNEYQTYKKFYEDNIPHGWTAEIGLLLFLLPYNFFISMAIYRAM